jgi:hypothetical protein
MVGHTYLPHNWHPRLWSDVENLPIYSLLIIVWQDLKDFARGAGTVTFADVDRNNPTIGCVTVDRYFINIWESLTVNSKLQDILNILRELMLMTPSVL